MGILTLGERTEYARNYSWWADNKNGYNTKSSLKGVPTKDLQGPGFFLQTCLNLALKKNR